MCQGNCARLSFIGHGWLTRFPGSRGTSGFDGGGGKLTDLEGDAGLVTAVDGDIDGVMAGFFELEVLDVNDEIARDEIPVIGEHDVGRQFDAGHDGAAVFIDEVHTDLVLALFDPTEDDAEGDGTLGVHGGELMGDDGIERAEEVEFAGVIGGGIAKHGDLNVHGWKQWMVGGMSQTKSKAGLVGLVSAVGYWKSCFVFGMGDMGHMGDMSGSDQVWQELSVVRRYLEGLRGGIPLAAEQIDILLRLVRAARPRVKRFLDLGCGDGVLGRVLLEAHGEAEGVFVDFSEPMIEAARRALGDTKGERYRVVLEDYGRREWVSRVGAEARFDVVVSGFSIHHQTDERKRQIYGEIFEILEPGGIFLNLEHVASRSAWGEALFDEYFTDSIHEHHVRTGGVKSRQEIADAYVHRADKAANILAPVEDQCAWLRELGYERVDCFFKTFELALFGGCRPLTGE
jgi:tRNA (cmo5U34)-methyltransferase